MSVSTIYSVARGEASLPPRLDRAHPRSTSLLGSQSWSTPQESHTKSGPVGPRNADQAGLGPDGLGLILVSGAPFTEGTFAAALRSPLWLSVFSEFETLAG